jgi:AraC family transcriptional regulator of adaptative response/methylated-DNA-[protein]-cysteine methyltransferase
MDLWLARHDFRVRSLKSLGYSYAPTPCGECVALATDSHLVALYFTENLTASILELQCKWPKATLFPSSKVDRFITGAFENPEKVPIMAIGTPFQLSIWEFLRSIPSASTMTYGEVAQAIGRPRAARAIGQAVGVNEISVVIPCHRIVSRGKLTGYRWGLERKKQLLARELLNQNQTFLI